MKIEFKSMEKDAIDFRFPLHDESFVLSSCGELLDLSVRGELVEP